MAKISGVSVELITKLGGVSKQLVRKLGGKLTAELGFGPDYNPGPSCVRYIMYYSAVSLIQAVNNANNGAEPIAIETGDDDNWYSEGQCGQSDSYAATGYYFLDHRGRQFYWYWNADSKILTELSAPVIGPTNTIAPNLFANFAYPLLWTSTNLSVNRGTWTGTGNISYTYNWYSNGTLIATQGPYPTTDTKGNVIDPQPTIPIGANQMFETLELQITATDDNGSTTVSTDTQIQDATLNTFLSNSGITDPTRIAALEYLRKALATSTTQLLFQTNMDYYPFAGETAEQNKWSLGNPSEYLQFVGGWSHSRDGSQASYGVASSTKAYNNTFNNIQFAYGMYTNTNEISDFRDLTLVQTFGSNSYGWDFGAQRRVNGVNKVYWTHVRTDGVVGEETYNVSAGSVGLSGLHRTRNNIGVNQMFVISAGVQQDPVSFFGNHSPYYNSVFQIGGSTKNYQFAFIANFLTAEQTTELNTILQTYNAMLGR